MHPQVYKYLRLNIPRKEIAKLTGLTYSQVKRAAQIKPVRVLLFGDSHCGANTGLTPPAFQYKFQPNPKTEEHRIRNKYALMQQECWNWYIKEVEKFKPINKVFLMGDLIDGPGYRSGGTELITTDRKVQTTMAIEAIEIIEADGMIMVFGTPYHTGTAEDFEMDIATHFKIKIGGHEWENINGCIFDLKHKQSNTKNPFTSLYNEVIDNREWAVTGEQPKADVIIRAHTHRYCFFRLEDCVAITIPALQSYGTKFGARQCTRKVQFGLIALDVWPDGYVQEHISIAKLTTHITKSN